MDYIVHGILQARILEWVAFSFSRGSSQPRKDSLPVEPQGEHDKPKQHIRKLRHHFPCKGSCIKSYGFSSSHVQMWELDRKESWAPKNWCFWTVVLEKTLESPLDRKEIKPVYPKGDQPWILIGRTDAEAATPVLWPSDAKSWLIGRDPDAGKDWGQEEKGMTEGEMVGWHHRLNGHRFEKILGDGESQRRTGKPGVLQTTRLQTVRHNLVTEQKQ